MNFFEELLLYCAITGTVAFVASVVIGQYKVKAAKELKACTEMPSYDDAKKSLVHMAGVIFNRMRVLGFPELNPDKKHEFTLLNYFGICDDPAIIKFIRMAHAAGLEIVIRPRKEGRPAGGEEEEGGYVSASRESDYAH